MKKNIKNAVDAVCDEFQYRCIMLECRVADFTDRHPTVITLIWYLAGAVTGYWILKQLWQ